MHSAVIPSVTIYLIYDSSTRHVACFMTPRHAIVACSMTPRHAIAARPMTPRHAVVACSGTLLPFHSALALLVFLLLSFIIKKTRAYDDRQNRAVIPVYIKLSA